MKAQTMFARVARRPGEQQWCELGISYGFWTGGRGRWGMPWPAAGAIHAVEQPPYPHILHRMLVWGHARRHCGVRLGGLQVPFFHAAFAVHRAVQIS